MCPFCKDKPCNEEHCPYTKEKKAFENWLKDNFSELIKAGDEGGLAKMNDDLTQCWLAACEYKQKEIDEVEKEKDYLCKKMENMRQIYKEPE